MAHDPTDPIREKLLQASLSHVAFDGWSPATFDAAVQDSGLSAEVAHAACPRGAVDLAAAYHRRGDAAIDVKALGDLRYSEKVAALVRQRIEATDREIVRRGMTLFALPHHAPEGARLIWDTADAIWKALGDTSRDANWYSKRAILSGVFSATVLYWLGDQSDDQADTWAFLDRRIEDVMRFEKTKAKLNENKLASALLAVPNAFLSRVKAPASAGGGRDDLPGWRAQ